MGSLTLKELLSLWAARNKRLLFIAIVPVAIDSLPNSDLHLFQYYFHFFCYLRADE